MATGDLTISWAMRPRALSDWIDGIDAPLIEATEAYEVDILDDDGATVVRTLSSSTESVVYTAAQQAADFSGDYSPPVSKFLSSIYWSGSDWTGPAGGDLWISTAAATRIREVSLLRQARFDKIDAGVGTATFSLQAAGTPTLSIGFEFLGIGGQSLGIDDSTPAAPGGSAVTVSHTANVPPYTRSIRLRVIAGGADVTVDAPGTLTLAAALRPVKARVRQLGVANIAGFNRSAAL